MRLKASLQGTGGGPAMSFLLLFTPQCLCRARFLLVPKGSACSQGGGEDVDPHESVAALR